MLRKGRKIQADDVGISFSAPWIIPKKLIDKFEGKLFNLHNQPLPRFRGAGGASWNIIMEDKNGGSCIHRLTEKIDAGEIFAKRNFIFPKKLKFPKDYDDYSTKIALSMLEKWLVNYLKSGSPGKVISNPDSESEYWPRLNTDIHAWIDWSWNLNDIKSFCYAFSFPHAGAKSYLGKKIVRILDIEIIKMKNKFHPFQTGLIFRQNKKEIFIAHREGIIKIKRKFIHFSGDKIKLGDRFHTPHDKLDASFSSKIQYAPDGKVINLK